MTARRGRPVGPGPGPSTSGQAVARAPVRTNGARGRVGSTPTLSPLLTEAQLQRGILDAAALYGYRVWHNTYAIGSDRGWPDLVLVRVATRARPGRLIFAELKGPRGRVRPDQAVWLQTLREAGQEVYLWDSREISLQEITDILAREVTR